MSDLISRQAAIDALMVAIDDVGILDGDDIKVVFDNLQSAQQEIIRCKDCKWYEIYQLKKDGTDDRRYRPSYCVNLVFHSQPDWYCADGERREDEAD